MRTTLRRDRAWIIVGVIVVGAIVLLITAVSMADERATDIWVNLADSAAQIVVLALAGGVVGAVLRDRDARREDNRRSQASLLAFANQVELAFNEIKAARRILRTFGFDAPAGRTLTGEQATGFRAQMAQLNDTELSVEMYARVVEAQRSLFEPNAESLQHELAAVSRFLRRVLLEWETDSTVVGPGADASALAGWKHFGEFVGYDDESSQVFRAGIAEPLTRIELLLMSERVAPRRLTNRPDTRAGEAGPDRAPRCRRASRRGVAAEPDPRSAQCRPIRRTRSNGRCSVIEYCGGSADVEPSSTTVMPTRRASTATVTAGARRIASHARVMPGDQWMSSNTMTDVGARCGRSISKYSVVACSSW